MSHKHTLRSIDVRDAYQQEYFLQRVDGYDQFAVALWRAGFRQVRVWFDSPAPAGRLSIVKCSLLYNVLFGGNLTAVGIK